MILDLKAMEINPGPSPFQNQYQVSRLRGMRSM